MPLLASLNVAVGWRGALTFVVLMLALVAGLALLFIRNHPADLGLAPCLLLG